MKSELCKNALLILALCVAGINSFGYKIEVNCKYLKAKKIELESESVNYFVQSFSFVLNEELYEIKSNTLKLKTWSIFKLGNEIGHVNWADNQSSYNQWNMFIKDDEINIRFYGWNDPRELFIDHKDTTYYMTNTEPDCNSIFGLDRKDRGRRYVEPDETGIYGEASKPCGKTSWSFNVIDESISKEVITGFIFTSVVAMNVRGFEY